MPEPVEIACDESGFTGGNLTFRHAVFSHASLRLPRRAAQEEMDRLSQRVSAHGELKASWLLRWCDDDDLQRLLGRDGLLGPDGLLGRVRPDRNGTDENGNDPNGTDPNGTENRVGARVRVHLTDTRLFLLTRMADVLLGTDEVSGLDLPGQSSTTRETALELHRHGEAAYGLPRWQGFLVAAGRALRPPGRWVPATAVSDFEGELGVLAALPAPAGVREALLRLRAAAGRARAVRRSAESDARRPPLMEPLLPALDRAVATWGADRQDLVVVHDEQSVLTPWRMTEIGHRLARAHPGHTLEVRRVDSRHDPRVQIADLVAGIARRAAASLLIGRPDQRLIELVAPYADVRSVWPDDSWRDGALRTDHGAT